MYLLKTSNEKIQELFAAKVGRSLIDNRVVYIGKALSVNLNTGIVSLADGTPVFKMSHIQSVRRQNEWVLVDTKNSHYTFVMA